MILLYRMNLCVAGGYFRKIYNTGVICDYKYVAFTKKEQEKWAILKRKWEKAIEIVAFYIGTPKVWDYLCGLNPEILGKVLKIEKWFLINFLKEELIAI